jgi:hypothetical protein
VSAPQFADGSWVRPTNARPNKQLWANVGEGAKAVANSDAGLGVHLLFAVGDLGHLRGR